MVSASDFVNGTSINWGRLGLTVIGGSFLAAFRGATGLLLALVDFPIVVARGFARWYGQLVESLLGPLAGTITAAWVQALGIIQSSGPVGFILALGVALASFYAFWRIVNGVLDRG